MQLAVRELKRRYATGRELAKEGTQVASDLQDVELDAAAVTETILALAEMKSKQTHRWILRAVAYFSFLASFAPQIVDLFTEVRCANFGCTQRFD